MDGKYRIENCSEVFRLVCPLSWDQLEQTEDTTARLCHACNKRVYLCGSAEEVQSHSLANDCIALSIKIAEQITDLGPMMGQPKKITALGATNEGQEYPKGNHDNHT